MQSVMLIFVFKIQEMDKIGMVIKMAELRSRGRNSMERKWWHGKVAYQIYPKSFNDTNGDGIGDLRGIIEKLDYLKQLGIDIIWISPIYESPFVDQGYDISNYYEIAKEFGTMDDFDELLAEAKKRDMYIVMDLVINHCSDQHEWFQKALKDPEGEYGDYFFFKKGKQGMPPTNGRSYFGGSAWEPVKGTDYYYLHFFAKEQPDLNWENPTLRQKLYDMICWWLEKGVAGFRIDAIMNIKKDLNFPDYEPDNPDGTASVAQMVESVEGVEEYLRDLKEHTFEKYDAFTVGEVFNMRKEKLKEFIGEDGVFSTIFDFSQHVLTQNQGGWFEEESWTLDDWKKTLYAAQEEVKEFGFYANILENHDEPRAISRFLPPYAQNDNGAKAIATISILLRGIPFIYQGQEIGMTNCPMDSIDAYDDISTKDQYREAISRGVSEEKALASCQRHSRDNARTPMQWSDEKNAGFTTGTPWIFLNPNYEEKNVKVEEDDKNSILHYYRKLVALRKNPKYNETFTYGDFEETYVDQEGIVAYYRKDNENTILVVANLSEGEQRITLDGQVEQILLSNQSIVQQQEDKILLQSCEALVIKLIS